MSLLLDWLTLHNGMMDIALAAGLQAGARPAARRDVNDTARVRAQLGQLASVTPAEALAALGSSAAGLPAPEAARRRRDSGPNTVGESAGVSPWRFVQSLANPLPLLMLALAGLGALTGARWSALLIVAIVLASTLLGYSQEHRSAAAAERLRAMVRTTVAVRRPGAAGGSEQLPSADLVPGDVITLAAGDAIPADLRILEARNLFLDVSALTGEAMPVERSAAVVPDAAARDALAVANLACMGCHVLSGTAVALVAATGAGTAFGAIAAVAAAVRETSAFDRGIDRYVWLLIRFVLVLVPLVFLLSAAGSTDWLQALLFAVAVAVGLTPELLPMIVTVNLAQGALAMAPRSVIVKRLNAIQNLGAMDILCTDKTGTLTQNRVILERHVDYLGRDCDCVTGYAWLNSRYQSGLRNLLDEAVLRYVERYPGLCPRGPFEELGELPFDFERRRMSVVIGRPDGTRVLVCKGAVKALLPACTRANDGGREVPLQAHHGSALSAQVDALDDEGFRVIAVATRELPDGTATLAAGDERDMVLQGYIAFLDPPKDSAAEAIVALAAAGVEVKVLTGDSAGTTNSVCRHVGLTVRATVPGDLLPSDDAALAVQAEATTVFARVSPQQKADIIRALQQGGHVVGYLGDGINDTQALRVADVGISVDDAVDIAKDSADVILLRKSLLVLVDGVMEGRRVFGNITKYLRISAGSVAGNVLSVVGASMLLPFLPMAPAQILLNNLLYDLSQVALAGDRVDAGWLRRPRRWHTGDIVRAMAVLGPLSSLFDYLTFGMLWFALGAAGHSALFQTGWFVESLLSQTLVVLVLRTSEVRLLRARCAPVLAATTAAACLAAAWLPYSAAGAALGFVPLPLLYWVLLAPLLACYLVLAQVVKRWLPAAGGAESPP